MKPNPRGTVVAFDLGGVVVDVDKAHLAVEFGSDAAFFAGTRHDDLSTGRLGAAPYATAVAGDLGVTAGDVVAAWMRVVRWSPGGLELLRDVAARARALVWSNTDPIHYEVLRPEIERFVARDDIRTSFHLGVMKPDPRYFARACAGVDAKDVVYVDDRDDNVAAARACGIDAVVVNGVDAARAAIFARLG